MIAGGLRFYDRVEVKTILDYLRVINQPDNNDALSRIINTPSRRIGETTTSGLLEEADKSKITLWSLILGTVQGKRTTKTKLTKTAEKGISEFVNIILTARNKMTDPEHRISTVDLIDFVCKKTNYQNWLKDTHADVHGARWDNVQELITQAREFQCLITVGYENEFLPKIDGLEQDEESDHLSRFLANVALASEVKRDEDGADATIRLTISTIHAAKGLEWPIVFIPALYQGSIPHSRSDDTDEERRLLYVAMTRAKALLYMSIPLKNSQGEQAVLSPFLSPLSLAPLLDQRGPSLSPPTLKSIAQILRRPLPTRDSLSKRHTDIYSVEDDLFPVDGEDENSGNGSVYFTNWKTSCTRGQMAAKRQRTKFGQGHSHIEQDLKPTPELPSLTSMDRASNFIVGSVFQSTAFISGGSLLALDDQSVDCTGGSKRVREVQDGPKLKMSDQGALNRKGMESQGTLLGFLGKAEPRPLKRSAITNDPPERSEESRCATNPHFTSKNIEQSSSITCATELSCISPALASHRLGVGQATRPKSGLHVEQHKRNDYVFLSSSPPRTNPSPAEPETVPERQPPGLSARPALMPLLRPATSMHTTSVASIQGGVYKKTLGVKRSMIGWRSQKGNEFVPPTIKRPG